MNLWKQNQPIVCHVTTVHQRHDVRIFHKECRSLAANGYNVVLLVNDTLANESLDGVNILSTHFKPKNRIDRMINATRLIKTKIREINAHVYHFHDPELLPIAGWTKRQGKKVIFDFHEDVSQQILYKHWIPKPLRKAIASIYRCYESQMIGKFDGVISVTPKIVERLKAKNPNAFMVTNYPILKTNPIDASVPKANVVCFAGGIYPQWNHHTIMDAIATLDGVQYELAGKGDANYLEQLKSHPAWSKVSYLGKIPHEAVNHLYAKSKIGLAILSFETQVGGEGTLGNTKVFEFMEAGLPIICSNNKIWTEMVEKYPCGILVDPNDVNGLRDAIRYYLDHPEEAQKAGLRGRQAVEAEYNWTTQAAQLLTLYAEIHP